MGCEVVRTRAPMEEWRKGSHEIAEWVIFRDDLDTRRPETDVKVGDDLAG